MTEQMRQLAAMPDITLQILPAIVHPANASGFVIADEAAWCVHVIGGFVYTDQTVRTLLRLFDTPSLRELPRLRNGSTARKDGPDMGNWRKL